MLSSAIRLNRLNISVAPCLPKSKHFDVKAMKVRGYKLADLKETLPTLEDLEYWFSDGQCNMAVLTTDRFIAVDFDLQAMYANFKKYPIHYTMTQKTGRGYHCFFWLTEPISKDFEITWPRVEVKHSGMPVMATPSIHPNGQRYEVIEIGLLNRFTVLNLTDIFALPFIEKLRHKPRGRIKKGSYGPIESQLACGLAAISSLMRQSRIESELSINQLKNSIPISQFLATNGYKLQATGEGVYLTNCPFHPDKNPSFWIDENYHNCNCYKSSCKSDRAMDIIDLYQRMYNCSIKEAMTDLNNYVGDATN